MLLNSLIFRSELCPHRHHIMGTYGNLLFSHLLAVWRPAMAVEIRSRLMRCLRLKFDFDSADVRRAFDRLSDATKVAVAQPASRSHADLFIYYFGRNAATQNR